MDYMRLGDKEKAIYWLQRCYEEGGGINFMKVEPLFDSLHTDPRFSELIRRMGFPD